VLNVLPLLTALLLTGEELKPKELNVLLTLLVFSLILVHQMLIVLPELLPVLSLNKSVWNVCMIPTAAEPPLLALPLNKCVLNVSLMTIALA